MLKIRSPYRCTQDLIDKVASIAANAKLIGEPLTPTYVASMANCSITFAIAMLQYWTGAGCPISDD